MQCFTEDRHKEAAIGLSEGSKLEKNMLNLEIFIKIQ